MAQMHIGHAVNVNDNLQQHCADTPGLATISILNMISLLEQLCYISTSTLSSEFFKLPASDQLPSQNMTAHTTCT